MPVVALGNKADLSFGAAHPNKSGIYAGVCWKLNIKYYEVSALSNYNFEKPFLTIIQHYLGANTQFVDGPGILPPEAGGLGIAEYRDANEGADEESDQERETDENSEEDLECHDVNKAVLTASPLGMIQGITNSLFIHPAKL